MAGTCVGSRLKHASERWPSSCGGLIPALVINTYYEVDGAIVFREACRLGCEGIVSKRLGSPYRSGRTAHWIKVKNPKSPAVKREAEEDWR